MTNRGASYRLLAKNKDNNKTVGFKAATQVNGIDAGTDDTSVQSVDNLPL